MTLTPAEARLVSQISAHKSWAQTADRTARTLPARLAAIARFEKLVDPDGVYSPAVRAKMAESARKAFYREMALKSARVRRQGGCHGD